MDRSIAYTARELELSEQLLDNALWRVSFGLPQNGILQSARSRIIACTSPPSPSVMRFFVSIGHELRAFQANVDVLASFNGVGPKITMDNRVSSRLTNSVKRKLRNDAKFQLGSDIDARRDSTESIRHFIEEP